MNPKAQGPRPWAFFLHENEYVAPIQACATLLLADLAVFRGLDSLRVGFCSLAADFLGAPTLEGEDGAEALEERAEEALALTEADTGERDLTDP